MRHYIYQAILAPDEEGGYDVTAPALPGLATWGATYEEAAMQAADAMRTYVASLLRHGDPVPGATVADPGPGEQSVMVYFETDADYIVEGEVISAAEASRRLGVSAGRVTHMLDSGILEGYRKGRRTYITERSVQARLASGARPGRPAAR